jgi:rhamnosyl/mannosyltransferase
MRVIHAYKVYRPEVEGGVPQIISQLTAFRDYGDDVRIVVATLRGSSRDYELDGTRVKAIRSLGQISSMPISPEFPFVLRQAARHCDVLALHAPFPLNDLGVLLGVPDDVAVVVHWHAEIVGRNIVMPIVAPIVRHTLKRADKIIVSDQSLIDHSAALAPFRHKCAVIPFGVDFDYWSSLSQSEKSEADAIRKDHPRLIVSMGRLVPYKGYDVLLRALQGIPAELMIIGEGSERDYLKQLARELGVADRVTIAGYLPRDSAKAHISAARVFVMPSVSEAETFGIAQIEAMAVGVPIVNTSLQTAVPRIARDGLEGRTVPPKDPELLARAINSLLDEPVQAEKFAAAGRRRVQTEYAQSVFVERVRRTYSEAVSSRR